MTEKIDEILSDQPEYFLVWVAQVLCFIRISRKTNGCYPPRDKRNEFSICTQMLLQYKKYCFVRYFEILDESKRDMDRIDEQYHAIA